MLTYENMIVTDFFKALTEKHMSVMVSPGLMELIEQARWKHAQIFTQIGITR